MPPGLGLYRYFRNQFTRFQSNPNLTSSQRDFVGTDYRPFGSTQAMGDFQNNFRNQGTGQGSSFTSFGQSSGGQFSNLMSINPNTTNVNQFARGLNTADIRPGQGLDARVNQGGQFNSAVVNSGRSAHIHQGNGDQATNNAISKADNTAFVQRGMNNSADGSGSIENRFWQGGYATEGNNNTVNNSFTGSNNRFGYDAGTQVGTNNTINAGQGSTTARQHAWDGGSNTYNGANAQGQGDITQSGNNANNQATFGDASDRYTGMGNGSNFDVNTRGGNDNVDMTQAQNASGNIDTGAGNDNATFGSTSSQDGLNVNMGAGNQDTANFNRGLDQYNITANDNGSFTFRDANSNNPNDQGTTISGAENFNFTGANGQTQSFTADSLRAQLQGGGGQEPGGAGPGPGSDGPAPPPGAGPPGGEGGPPGGQPGGPPGG